MSSNGNEKGGAGTVEPRSRGTWRPPLNKSCHNEVDCSSQVKGT
jgi:hypothetical protein